MKCPNCGEEILRCPDCGGPLKRRRGRTLKNGKAEYYDCQGCGEEWRKKEVSRGE